MDKYKTKLFLISAIFFTFMISPIYGHDGEMIVPGKSQIVDRAMPQVMEGEVS